MLLFIALQENDALVLQEAVFLSLKKESSDWEEKNGD